LSPPVLYLIVCGAGPAHDVPAFLRLARSAGCAVCVAATPQGLQLLDLDQVAALTDHPVRADYSPVSPPWPHADAILVAPATLNTVNKLAAGIADSFALALLTECLGLDLPVFVAPNVNPALARHPRFRASLDELAAWGVHVLYERTAPPPIWMTPWAEIIERLSASGLPGLGVGASAEARNPHNLRGKAEEEPKGSPGAVSPP
jgi:phosphopantothenoylcysteine synthetase/decarboxylase